MLEKCSHTFGCDRLGRMALGLRSKEVKPAFSEFFSRVGRDG